MESSGRGHRDGVEITSIGVLYQGLLEKKYWSSSRGKEKYPYPVGYQATRWHGGHCYYMEVTEGARGPSFVVKCEEGIICSGQTPSVAWEDILKKKHVGAKRVLVRSSCDSIDGAEMFGFTNPLVQRLCRDLVVSAIGAAENSNTLPGEEDAAEGARRNAGLLAESSQKSPAKASRGKKLLSPPKVKNLGDGAEAKDKNAKQTVALQVLEEAQGSKEAKKQRLKRPARDSVERSESVKVEKRAQLVSPEKDFNAFHSHSEDEDVPVHSTRSKRSRIPKSKEGPLSAEGTEPVGSSPNINSAISRKVKSPTIGAKRMKGEDAPEGQNPKDSVHVNTPPGVPDGDRQKDAIFSTLKDIQQSSAAYESKGVSVSQLTISVPAQMTAVSDPANVDESSPKVTSGKKKRMKLGKPQKIVDSIKHEKYDTEVDLTQSEGFLSIDLMCPSAEDMKKQTSESAPAQGYEDFSSKQDGYLMLLAACKVAEVEQENVTREKTGTSDVRRKRPICDLDLTLKATNATSSSENVSTSSKAPRLSEGVIAGVNEFVTTSSDLVLNVQPSQSFSSDGRPCRDSIQIRAGLFDINLSPTESPRGDHPFTVLQPKEYAISHEKLEDNQIGNGLGERVLIQRNTQIVQAVESLEKSLEKEGGSGFGHISERLHGLDHNSVVHTTGSVHTSVRLQELSGESLSPKEQHSIVLEAAKPGVEQVDASQQDEDCKKPIEDHPVLMEKSVLEERRNDGIVTSCSTVTESSATCMVLTTDVLPLKKDISGYSGSPLKNFDPGQVDPDGEISPALEVMMNLQISASGIEVSDSVEYSVIGQSKFCAAEASKLETTCDLQIVDRPACVTFIDVTTCDEEINLKKLQGSPSLTSTAVEAQGSLILHDSIISSQSEAEGTSQLVAVVENAASTATMITMDCFEGVSHELRKPVVKVNGTETGTFESSLQQLYSEALPDQSASLARETKYYNEVRPKGIKQDNVATVLDTHHPQDVVSPTGTASMTSFASPSQTNECPSKIRISSNELSESLPPFSTSTSESCLDAEATRLEGESKGVNNDTGLVSGASLYDKGDLPMDSAAEVHSRRKSEYGNAHSERSEKGSMNSERQIPLMDMDSGAVPANQVDFGRSVSAEVRKQSTEAEATRLESIGRRVSKEVVTESDMASGAYLNGKEDSPTNSADTTHVLRTYGGQSAHPDHLVRGGGTFLRPIPETVLVSSAVPVPLELDLCVSDERSTRDTEAEVIILESESKGAVNENDMVSGGSLNDKTDLPTESADEVHSPRKSEVDVKHPHDLESGDRTFQKQTPETAVVCPAVQVVQVESGLCVSAERSSCAMGEGAMAFGSELGRNSEDLSEKGVNTDPTSNQVEDIIAQSLSGMNVEVPSLDVDGSEEAGDRPEKDVNVITHGTLDVEMVSSAPSIDMVHSAVSGSSESREQGSKEELVPRSMEAVKDTGSEGACEVEHARANHPATVPGSVQEIGEPLDAPFEEHVDLQVSGLKGCTESGDHPNSHISVTITPLNWNLEAGVVSSDLFVDKMGSDFGDRGTPVLMEKLSPAFIEDVKNIESVMEVDHGKASETDVVTICSPNHRVSDSPSQEGEGLDDTSLDLARIPVFVTAVYGPANSGGPKDEQPAVINQGEMLVQGVLSNLPSSTGERSEDGSSISQQTETERPVSNSCREEIATHGTNSISLPVSDVVVLVGNHEEVDSRTTSNQEDLVMMEVVCSLPSQVHSSASSEILGHKAESDSAGRELTTSMMTLLLPQAVPFLSSTTGKEKKQVPVLGNYPSSKTEDMDIEATAALVPSVCQQANISLRSLESQVSNGEEHASKSMVVAQQLEEVNGPVLNQEETVTVGDSAAELSIGGHPVVTGPKVIAGVQVTSLNGNFEEDTLSSEESPVKNISFGIIVSNGDAHKLEGGKACEVQSETNSLFPTVVKGNRSEVCNQEHIRSDVLPESTEDDCEISQPVPLSGVLDAELCQDNARAVIITAVRDDVADEDLDSCFTSQIAPLNDIDTQDSVKVIGLQSDPSWKLRTSTDISTVEGAAQVQHEAQVCTKAMDSDLLGRSMVTKADMNVEVACMQLAGCIKPSSTDLPRVENSDSERIVTSPSDLRMNLAISTKLMINDETSLDDHPRDQVFARISREMKDLGEGRDVDLEESERCQDSMSVENAPYPSISSGKVENKPEGYKGLQSGSPFYDSSGGNLDQSEDTSALPAAISSLPEQGIQSGRETTHSPQPSFSSKLTGESGKKEPSYFQKMELPIIIEHPTKVSTMVINVRGDEIKLCVCCGTGSERTLFVFKVKYREGDHFEHQLLTVVEATFKNNYNEMGNIKLYNEESGLSFTPDGQQLILLDCFKLRDSSTADSHDGHGITIVSLEKDCKASTRLKSDGALLCLVVREPQHLIAAGDDGLINLWDMDPSWRSFEKKILLPKAAIDGVPFTSVTSLLIVPHLPHMVVGCNPSGFFALWDINRRALLYSCQMFDDVLLRTSLIDMRTVNWEQFDSQGDPFSNCIPQKTSHGESQESLSDLPLIVLLTMVTSKERFLSEKKEEVLISEEIKSIVSEEHAGFFSKEKNSKVIGADVLTFHDGTKVRKQGVPQQQTCDATRVDLEPQTQETKDEEMELRSKDFNSADTEDYRETSGPWDCKTVLLRGGRIVCGHALSDRPTSLSSMGCYGVMGTAAGLVHLWDVEKGTKVAQLNDLEGSAIVSLATSSSLAVLATAGENKQVNVYLQKDHFAEVIKKTS
ncbi:hypothetical protein MPTK1_1g20550 [Marchantia polymorpha subsp. ruderalis]|uniref:Uncharacterized protein n=2 Tax=Marchantia polymorpha TaxID=3197 RepID=A0AAF6ASB7_MARPO|nr:hypothetical protein MARPO_0001s0391 [Marchantia polymorpha]BBM99337.1 hypothetical protein Mp_1g20550 [Marchantia polymorpha subsp. ruderalis]|eukprot:PTQ50419.1 hypothetical protein MARPO_0001s0391 [Marchantia polymorpha]